MKDVTEVPSVVYGQLAEIIVRGGAKRATKYLSPLMVVKATRVSKKLDKREPTKHFVVTAGRPNYAEREMIKTFKKAGESFPVRRIQIKW